MTTPIPSVRYLFALRIAAWLLLGAFGALVYLVLSVLDRLTGGASVPILLAGAAVWVLFESYGAAVKDRERRVAATYSSGQVVIPESVD